MSRLSFRPRPLDIHKKLPIVKSVKDLDNDEAATVSRTVLQDHGVGNSDNEVVQSTSTKRRGGDIPTPQYSVVETYERDYARTFMQPSSYVRSRGARNEPIEFVEYDLDDEDEDWLEQFNSERRILLPERFEWMLYKLELLDHKCRERAGEMPTILGVAVPVLLQQEVAVEALRSQNSRSAVLSAVCDYWKAKREQWQKPILRRLQPPPPVNDTNPFNVFRPREKVHRPHTRRMQRRENDVQSFEKLRQVRRNLERARALLGVIQKREVKKRELVECEANLQRVQITFKHDSQVDDEDLMVSSCAMVTTYPRKSSFFKRDAGDALPQQSNFARGTSNFVNGHVDIQPMCELTPPFTDGAVMLEPVDQSKRKGRRRRLPQQRGRPLKRVTALDSLEPVLLFTKPLDAEKLAATGLVPPLDSSQENGSAREPYCFHGRVGRGGRIIFDRCNPLTRTPLGYSNSTSTFSRLASVTRFLPPPPRLNLETTKPLETKSSAVDGTLESTLNGDLRTS